MKGSFMTDNKIKEAYRQIKAPDHLRRRVMALSPRKSRMLEFPIGRVVKIASYIAACFAIVAVISVALLVNNTNSAAIVVSGERVGGSPVELIASPSARSAVQTASAFEEIRVEFTLESKDECRVKVNCGEISEAKESYTDGDTLVWSVSEIPEEGAELYLEYGDKTSTYTLIQSAETGVWTINKQ